jgi:putative CocE/NonD family hydrolase
MAFAHQPSRLVVERNVDVPMRDGAILRADVYRPAAPGRYPVLLTRTPYNKARLIMAGSALDPVEGAERGYAVVLQDVRGRYASDGEFNPFFQEIYDGYDTVEWAGTRDWSDGNVGMYGGSYGGATQWLAAITAPPHLKTIVPMITASDYHEGWAYQGGAFEWGFGVSWVMTALAAEKVLRDDAAPQVVDDLVWAIDHMREAFLYLPLRDLPYLKNDLAPYFFDWLAHPDDDPYWEVIRIASRYGKVRVPSLNIGGWYDIFLGGTVANYLGMRERGGSETAKRGSRLWIGPWLHALPPGSLVGAHDFGMRSADANSPLRYDFHGQVFRWFDRWLKGADNGVDREPPVRIFQMGTSRWHEEAEWPPARVRATDYFLHSDGHANTLSGDGSLSRTAPNDEPPDRFIYDPATPVPTRGGQLCCYPNSLPSGAFDQREVELRPDVLVYSTASLERDLEVTGPIRVVLWAASSAPDTDFTAKLVDVAENGYARNLTDGIIRARYREGTSRQRLIEPNRVYEYTIDLWATSNVFLAGHRIRLEISSSNFPRFDRNPNTGHPFGIDAELRTAQQTIYHDAAHPSRVTLMC